MLFLGPESLDSEKSEELGRTERRPHLGSSRRWLLQQGDDNGGDVDNDDNGDDLKTFQDDLYLADYSQLDDLPLRGNFVFYSPQVATAIYSIILSFQFESQKSLQVLMTSSSGSLKILAILLRSSKPGDVRQDHWPLYQEHPKKPPSPSMMVHHVQV